MIFRQFYSRRLGHASYLLGSAEAGTGAVVDPQRDVEQYLRAAREEHLQITHVLETHTHNDYVSGARELSARVGARVVAGANSGLQYDHQEVRDEDELRLGDVVLRALKTPGHTPEHVCYVVADEARGRAPWLVLSGGSLLVGAVGRPDLLGAEKLPQLAAALYYSLHDKLLSLPDYVEVYPTHVSGSLCGAHINMRLSTSIGYERRFNRYAQLPSAETFAAEVLADLPGVPRSWPSIRALNQSGPPVLRCPLEPTALTAEEVRARLQAGHLALDTRSPHAFGGAHVPGAFSVWLEKDFPSWVGWVVPSDQPLILILERQEEFDQAATELSWIGYDRIAGYLDEGMWAWQARGYPLAHVPQLAVDELHRMLSDPRHPMVLDVRHDPEWRAGHIPGAVHIPGGQLPERADQLDKDRPIAVLCATGFRSSVAASVLQRHGFRHVLNVLGGFIAWQTEGYEVVAGGRDEVWE